MDEKKIYARGVAAESETEVFLKKLDMYNASRTPRFKYGNTPPGGFFANTLGQDNTCFAEDWANMVAERENKKPAVIKVEVDKGNFEAVRGKLYNVIHGASGHDYVAPQTFGEVDGGGQVTIDMSNLSPEDIISLNTEVGFKGEDGKFHYRRVNLQDFK